MATKKKISDPLAGYITRATEQSITQYVRNLKEWSAENRVFCSRASGTSSGTITLYTVPLGKVLFITNGWLSGHRITAGVGGTLDYDVGSIFVGTTNAFLDDGVILTCHSHNPAIQGLSISYGMPIKVVAGKTVKIKCFDGTNFQFYGGFCGWLVDA
jgi:hypothetical protein